jgi:Secretion system C-terminal sorting domain
MIKAKQILLAVLMMLCVGTSFSQTQDSLSVFPNPFSVSTNIHFDIVNSDTLTLRVFSVFGQAVRTYYQSTILPAGSYDINFAGDSLGDGVYFVILDIGSTKKLTRKAIKTGTSARLDDVKADQKGLIFPNPTTNRITIPLSGIKTIVITDQSGKMVKSINTDQDELSLTDLPEGQYVLSILNPNGAVGTKQKIQKRD